MILLAICIPNISLGVSNLEKPTNEFKNFNEYLKCVESLTATQVDSKINSSYFKETTFEDPESAAMRWAQTKTELKNNCASWSKNEGELEEQIDIYKNYLENAYESYKGGTVRPYQSEYSYLYVLKFNDSAQNAEEEVDENASEDELIKQFNDKADSIENQINEVLNGNLSSDELEEIRSQIDEEMLVLQNLLNTLKDKNIDEEKKDELTKRFEEVDSSFKKLTNETKDQEIEEASDSPIYQYPQKTSKNDGSEESLEDLIQDGDAFLEKGETNRVDQTALQNFSKTMYNILLAIGVVVAVIVGAMIGIKLMASSVDEQAEAKKLVIPYIVGCFILFGGFGIWKIIINILQGI